MIIIVMGVAGSGKTTIGSLLADELGWDFLDADDFHSAANRARMSHGIPLTDSDRATWLKSLRKALEKKIEANRSCVLACSALKETYRELLRVNESVRFVYLHGTYAQIKRRLMKRKGHYMHPSLLESQFNILELPTDGLRIEITLPPARMIRLIRKELVL
jgi:gluconokinase